MFRPKLSIITVSYNAVATIEATIESVLSQTFNDFEYLVVDGESTDGTTDVLTKYQRSSKLRYISEADNGIYDAMNKGISMTSGDWLYFLGADDLFFDNNVLENIFGKGNCQDEEVIYGNVKFLHSGKIYDGKFDHEKITNKNICHQALFVKRTVFEKLGLFNLKYKTCADHDFNLRWLGANLKNLYLDDIIVLYNEKGLSGQVFDEAFHKDFEKLLIDYNVISSRSFSVLKRDYKYLVNSRKYKLGSILLSPILWLMQKTNLR